MKNSPEGNRDRQRVFKDKMREQGYEQVTVWVPKTHTSEVQRIAEAMQEDPNGVWVKKSGKEMEVYLGSFNYGETPQMQRFWDIYTQLLTLGVKVNHSYKDHQIAIHLKSFYEQAETLGMTLPEKRLLIRQLPKSKKFKLIRKNASISSRLDGKTVRCYLFDNGSGGQSGLSL